MPDSQLGQVVSWYICTIAAVPFVGLRIFTKLKRSRNLSIDDYLIVTALLCLVGDLAIQQHMWNLGLGNMSSVSAANFKGIMQMIVPGSTLYVSSLWAIKFALVFFYKSLAAPGSRLVQLYNAALAGLAVTYLVIFFDIIFQCFPHDKRWSMDPKYQCSQKASDINYWLTIFFNIFTDVIIILCPITMVSRLHMKLKDKLGVVVVFSLGFFVVIASIVRAYYSRRNETMLTCTVSMVENAIAIIATCLPALRTMILGAGTSKGNSNSYGRHYELSSARRKADANRLTAFHESGEIPGHRANGSEDSLFSNDPPLSLAEAGKITVNTRIETNFESSPSTPSLAEVPKAKLPF